VLAPAGAIEHNGQVAIPHLGSGHFRAPVDAPARVHDPKLVVENIAVAEMLCLLEAGMRHQRGLPIEPVLDVQLEQVRAARVLEAAVVASHGLVVIDGVMHLHYHEFAHLHTASRAMAAILKAESTLTDRYQTTVPEPVRRALGLERRDKIKYTISASGEVILSRADSAEGNDPVLGEFLRFLAHDIAKAPESLRLIDAQLVQHLRALTKDVDVDLDAPLSPDDE